MRVKNKGGRATTKDDVIQKVQNNSIWLNAFSLVDPTSETYQDIGRMIVEMLKHQENLLPKYIEPDPTASPAVQEVLNQMSELTPVLYLRINAS